MITPHQMNLLTDPVADIYRSLEMEILKQITRRLKVRGETTITEYEIRKLNQLHLLNRDVEKYLKMASGVASDVIRESIQESGFEVIEDTDEYMLKAGKEILPKPSIEPLMESYVNQTFRELNNFVNQTLITTNFGEGVATDMYRKIIEETTAKVSTGSMTLEEGVEDTVKQWAAKGVPSAFIDKGGHTWSQERYVRTVLRSTNARIYNELRTSRMGEYGVHTVLVSSKPKARPACAHCQGKVLDTRTPMQVDSGYPSVYEFGYGQPDGHRGINCMHSWFPFIPGVSVNNQRFYEPKEAIRNEKIEQGRKEIARRIVKSKKMLMVTEELGSEGQEYYRKLLARQQKQMRDYIEKHKDEATFKLRRNYNLERVYTPLETLVSEYKE